MNFVSRKSRAWIVGLGLLIPGLFGLSSRAALINAVTLSDGNSNVTINPLNHNDPSNNGPGITRWTLDGVQQINNEQYYYRIGNGTPKPLTSLYLLSPTVDPATSDRVTFLFADSPSLNTAKFKVSLKYVLAGGQGGSGTADLAESFTVSNLTSTSMSFHLFLYGDYNLSNTPNNDTLALVDNILTQNDAATELTLPLPANVRYQIADKNAAITNSPGGSKTLLQMMTWAGGNGQSTFTLNNSGSVAPGDAVFAIQWDKTLAAAGRSGSSLTSSIDINLIEVPEPVLLPLLGTIGLGLCLRRRNRGDADPFTT